MSIQVYECREHGKFEVQYAIKEPVLPIRKCPVDYCGRAGDWRPSAPAVIIVEGGTGAAKGGRDR